MKEAEIRGTDHTQTWMMREVKYAHGREAGVGVGRRGKIVISGFDMTSQPRKMFSSSWQGRPGTELGLRAGDLDVKAFVLSPSSPHKGSG